MPEYRFANVCRVTQEGLAEKSTPGAESWAVTLEGTQCLDMWAFNPSERRDVHENPGIQLRHQKSMFWNKDQILQGEGNLDGSNKMQNHVSTESRQSRE